MVINNLIMTIMWSRFYENLIHYCYDFVCLCLLKRCRFETLSNIRVGLQLVVCCRLFLRFVIVYGELIEETWKRKDALEFHVSTKCWNFSAWIMKRYSNNLPVTRLLCTPSKYSCYLSSQAFCCTVLC